jgi:hypothetical protein
MRNWIGVWREKDAFLDYANGQFSQLGLIPSGALRTYRLYRKRSSTINAQEKLEL